jgi:hypothetical protein
VKDAFPVMQILVGEWGVETIGMASRLNIRGRSAFAEHLLDGISGDEVDEKEDEAYDQPDYWQGVEDALEEEFH